MMAELLRGVQGTEAGLHLAEESAALQDLLLQSLEVINVSHSVASVKVSKGTVWGLALQNRACWGRKQGN